MKMRVGWGLGTIALVVGCLGYPYALPELLDAEASTTEAVSTTEVSTTDASTNATSREDADAIDTGAQPVCGNGLVEVGETCDEAGDASTCDEDCTDVVCGDLYINTAAGEECEGEELQGVTCVVLGYGDGVLACSKSCTYDTSECYSLPGAPVVTQSISPVKRLDFSWAAVTGAEHYELLESPTPGDRYVQLGEDIVGESISFEIPLHLRWGASYSLKACNGVGCTDPLAMNVRGSFVDAIGYVKASNTGAGDWLGYSVALSADGNILAIGAPEEDSSTTGIDGEQSDGAAASGAVYVFVRDGVGAWSQQAYVKASNTDADDHFGYRVALSGDGSTLAVGASTEDSNATGIDGNQADDSAPSSGAVYVFVRNGMGAWSQQAYVKASNTDTNDQFGRSVALSGDGDTLAVGATEEDSNAAIIDGNQADDSAPSSGAVYVFVRDGMGAWSQQAYVKASNSGSGDLLGHSVSMSTDGDVLAVGAYGEDSNNVDAGAAYVFVRDGLEDWSQQAFIKASNTGSSDYFGISVALSGDGNTLAVGAFGEDSAATGIGGDQADDGAGDSGAVYVFTLDGMGTWAQQAYVKASNTGSTDQFGVRVALSSDGNALAVSAVLEDGSAIAIDGNQVDNSAYDAGTVYVFSRGSMGAWSQRAYVKAPNTGASDYFGWSLALSGDGNTLAVGTWEEDSNATGIGGNQANNSALASGAVYLY
jgi:trimeric autotransporter adhesin